jgi:hypothetical protein
MSIFGETEQQAILQGIRQHPPLSPLPLRAKPCDGCAVTCGFYFQHSEALRLADREEQVSLSAQWFCHETPSLACRGNADNLGVSW